MFVCSAPPQPELIIVGPESNVTVVWAPPNTEENLDNKTVTITLSTKISNSNENYTTSKAEAPYCTTNITQPAGTSFNVSISVHGQKSCEDTAMCVPQSSSMGINPMWVTCATLALILVSMAMFYIKF